MRININPIWLNRVSQPRMIAILVGNSSHMKVPGLHQYEDREAASNT